MRVSALEGSSFSASKALAGRPFKLVAASRSHLRVVGFALTAADPDKRVADRALALLVIRHCQRRNQNSRHSCRASLADRRDRP